MLVKYLLLVVVFVFSLSLHSQIPLEVKQKVDSFPSKMDGVSVFASIINYKFIDDADKVGAIYYWIANHIAYDTKTHFAKRKKVTYNFRYKTQQEKIRKIQKVDRGMAEDAFKQRKAVAKEFAYLFKKMCNNSGVECEVIAGSSKSALKEIGRKPGRTDHYWNAVKIKDKWHLVDVAMGSGFLDEEHKKFTPGYNEVFYLTAPEYFFFNHFPKQSKWLLCDRLSTEYSFLPLFYPSYNEVSFYLQHPSVGVVESLEGDSVQVIFVRRIHAAACNEPDVFSYAFAGRKRKAIEAKSTVNEVLLDIPFEGKKKDYLTIYRNNTALVSFKIDLNML